MSAVLTPLMTAEEFAKLPRNGHRQELVRGKVVEVSVPKPRHGKLLQRLGTVIDLFVMQNKLGHVLSEHGIITEREPDTVRGPDLAFYSYARLPADANLDIYLEVPANLVVEVRSPTDRTKELLAKVTEYLDAGVDVVLVVDPLQEVIHLYSQTELGQAIRFDEALTVPEVLPGFSMVLKDWL